MDFPLRLVVPGMEGIYQVKWLRRIKVVDQPYLTYQESSRFLHDDPRTQPNTYEFGPKSVITYPSGTQRLPRPGSYVISGLAWSGGGADQARRSLDRRWQELPAGRDLRARAAEGLHEVPYAVAMGRERSHPPVARD